MSIAPGDIIQFDLKGNYNNLVETHNVFHYEVGAYTGSRTPFQWIADAALSWANGVLDNICIPTSFAQKYTQIKVRIIFGADEGVQNTVLIDPETFVGQVEAESLPPHDVFTFRKQGSGGTERNGYQHYSGVPEAASSDGFLASGYTTLVDSIATELANIKTVFLDGDDGEASQGNIRPVIVKRVANGENPDDIDVLAKWYPVGVSFAKIGTVNSRKFGVGV